LKRIDSAMTLPVIHRVTMLDLSLQRWSGRVLLARNPDFTGDRFGADYFEADFASFLAWRATAFSTVSAWARCAVPTARSFWGQMGQRAFSIGYIIHFEIVITNAISADQGLLLSYRACLIADQVQRIPGTGPMIGQRLPLA
jgi:hypothetical protein